MNLDAATKRAQKAKGPKEGARLYADIEYELAMGEPTSDQEHAGESALSILEQRFPGVKDQSDEVVEDGHVPNMSRKAWNAVGDDGESTDERAGNTRSSPHTPRSGGGGPRSGGGRPARAPAVARAAVSGRRRGRSYTSAWRSTGIPAITGGSGSLGLQAIGGFLLLSLGYLALSPNGSKAVGSLLGGITTGLNAFVGTGDPFAKRATPGTIQTALAGGTLPTVKASPGKSVGTASGAASLAGSAGNIVTSPPSVKTATG